MLGVGLWGDAVKVSREEQEEARELLRYWRYPYLPSATVLPSGTLLAAAPAADESAMRGRCLPPGAPPTSSNTVTIKASHPYEVSQESRARDLGPAAHRTHTKPALNGHTRRANTDP